MAKDLPENADNPATNAEMKVEIAIITNSLLFLTTNIPIFFANKWLLDKLMKKINVPNNNATPKKVDRKARKRFWGMKNPVSNPAIATDHHGNTKPSA
jgi:hypothetical protein